MLKFIEGLPDNVLGITAEGRVTGFDYESILIPAVENKFKSKNKIRIIYHLGETFTGFDPAALLDDAKLGMKHLSECERIALVSDHPIINAFARFFGYLMKCEIQIFKEADLEKAKQWIIQ
jgi:hypothetical protein